MEFTELSELNDMISYSRSFRGTKLNYHKRPKCKSNGMDAKRSAYFELKFVSLEDVIESSLSSGKGSLRSPTETPRPMDAMKYLEQMSKKDKHESLDDILSDIQKTLKFQETVRQDKKVLKLKDEVQSITLNPNKVNENRSKRRVVRSSSFTFETDDYNEDYFSSPKKANRTREDGDVSTKHSQARAKGETDFSESMNMLRKISRDNSLKFEANSSNDKKSMPQEGPKITHESSKPEIVKVQPEASKAPQEVSRSPGLLVFSPQPVSPRYRSSFQPNGGSQFELNNKKKKIIEGGVIEERVDLEEEHLPVKKGADEGSKKNSAGKLDALGKMEKTKFSGSTSEDKICNKYNADEGRMPELKMKKVESCFTMGSEKRKAENENKDPNTNDNVLKMFSALPRRSSNRIQRHSSILYLGVENSKKKFDKMSTDKIEESFSEKIIKKSSLSVNLMQVDNPAKQSLAPSTFNKGARGKSTSKRKQIKIFYFSTPVFLYIYIGQDESVQEVIAAAMNAYICADSVDKSLLRFPNHPEAYELRFLEDDDDFKPETSFDPLEKERKFLTYNTDSLALCEIPNFKPSIKSALMRDPNMDLENLAESELMKRKEKEIEKIMTKKNNIVIDVSIVEENYSTLLALDPEKSVGDIFLNIQKRIKINPKKYIVMAMPPEDKSDRKDGEVQWEPEEVDINMPIRNLKTNKLQLIRKVYADEPKDRTSEYGKKEDAAFTNVMAETMEDDHEYVDPQNILLTEVQASKYEEFDVIKINNRGKRQPRLLGIDQFRIHNKIKERNQGGISNLFTLFTGNTTKNPERLIDKIKEVKMISSRIFYIEVLEENTRSKILTFEAKNNQTASYIFAKLNFLMKIKTHRKKK